MGYEPIGNSRLPYPAVGLTCSVGIYKGLRAEKAKIIISVESHQYAICGAFV